MMDKLKLMAQAEKSNVMEGIFRQANQRNDFYIKLITIFNIDFFVFQHLCPSEF